MFTAFERDWRLGVIEPDQTPIFGWASEVAEGNVLELQSAQISSVPVYFDGLSHSLEHLGLAIGLDVHISQRFER